MISQLNEPLAKVIFTSKFIRPVTYVKVLDKLYNGRDWVKFDPGTIRMDIKQKYGVDTVESVSDKISAIASLLTTPYTFLSDHFFFEKVILTFNDMYVNFAENQGCLPTELGYGLTVARQVVNPGQFDEDVIDYVRACANSDGLIVYHRSFKFAQPKYEDPNTIVKKILAELKGNTKAPPKSDVAKHQWDMLVDIQTYIKERLKEEKEVLKHGHSIGN